MASLLEVDHLGLRLVIDKRLQPVLRDVSFTLERREVLALVGESGSGKSMTARTILGLLPPGAATSGRVSFDGVDLLGSPAAVRALRGRRIGMIFQDPRASINAVHRIGDFLTEVLVISRGVKRADAMARAEQMLRDVGIDNPGRRLRQFPHELSGGMLQRIMIASVLLDEPELILADEPTTALDVTTQAEVVAILQELSRERDLAMVFITHDLELAAAIADRIAVMYAGTIVETSTAAQIHTSPRHPYTAGLLASRPELHRRVDRIPQIPGRPLSAFEAPEGCAFQDRCAFAVEACTTKEPALKLEGVSMVRCLRAVELAATGALDLDLGKGPAERSPAAEAGGGR